MNINTNTIDEAYHRGVADGIAMAHRNDVLDEPWPPVYHPTRYHGRIFIIADEVATQNVVPALLVPCPCGANIVIRYDTAHKEFAGTCASCGCRNLADDLVVLPDSEMAASILRDSDWLAPGVWATPLIGGGVMTVVTQAELVTADERNIDEVVRRIMAVGGSISVRQWFQSNRRRLRTAKAARAELQALVNARRAVMEDVPTGWRPSTVLRLLTFGPTDVPF